MADKPNNPVKNKAFLWIKYSGLGFQLAALVLVGYYLGTYLDKLAGFQKPVITLLLILLLFSAFMYKLYMELTGPKSEK